MRKDLNLFSLFKSLWDVSCLVVCEKKITQVKKIEQKERIHILNYVE